MDTSTAPAIRRVALDLPPPPPALWVRERAPALAGSVALVMLVAFEAVAVAAAMPAVAVALDGLGRYALAFGGMLATSIVGMVAAGLLSDRRGPATATALGLAAFAGGLAVAGAAPTMDALVAGRVLQGLGGGALGVGLYAGMGRLVPPALHPRLFSLFATAWVLPGLLGPALAAALVTTWGWRAVFLAALVAVPVAGALLLPALRRLPQPARAAVEGGRAADRPPPSSAPARLGWAVGGAAGALMLHAASARPDLPSMLALLGLGALTLGAAARRLLPAGSLRAAPGLPAVFALRGLVAAAFGLGEVLVPLHLTRGAGWSLAAAGLALSTGALAWSAGSALQARLQGDARRQQGLALASLLLATGLAGVAVQALSGAPAWLVLPAWAVAGLGIGLGYPMLSVLTLRLSAPAEQGRHAAALQLADAMASTAVLAVAGVWWARAPTTPTLAGLLLMMAMLAAAGAWLARRTLVAAAPRSGR